jgi:hypothetical protein
MARTVLGQEPLVKNGVSTAGTGTTLAVGGSGYYIAAGPGIPDRVVMSVAFTGATGTVTVRAGANPPAIAAGRGDLVVTGYNQTRFIRVYESARFLQADGTVNVDFSGSAATGTATLLNLLV